MSESDEAIEQLKVELEGVVNFLVGISLDPRLPTVIRDAIRRRVSVIQDVIDD